MSSNVARGTLRFFPRVDQGLAANAQAAVLFGVADVAELSVLDTSNTTVFINGAAVSMRSVLDLWMLNRDSVLAPDGITVVAAAGGAGNWERLYTHNTEWLSRTTWHINETTGDDENDGATGPTALATWAELRRRCGMEIAVGATVFIDSDLTQSITVLEELVPSDPLGALHFSIVGSRTVLFSGTVTTVTAYAPAANPGVSVAGDISAAAIPVSWTASGLLGKKIVLTSGVNSGAVAYVQKDLGAKTCRHSPFFDPNLFTWITPTPGDTFDVVDVTDITGSLVHTGSCSVLLQDLRFHNDLSGVDMVVIMGFAVCYYVEATSPYGMSVQTVGSVYTSGGGVGTLIGCRIRGGSDNEVGGFVSLYCCLFEGRISSIGGETFINLPCTVQGVAGESVFVSNIGYMRVQTPDAWLGIFDSVSAGAVFSIVHTAHVTVQDVVWGLNNTCAWFFQLTGGTILVATAVNLLNIAGAAGTSDWVIGTATGAYAALPTTDAANLAGIVLSA